jgi:hypothetical protein
MSAAEPSWSELLERAEAQLARASSSLAAGEAPAVEAFALPSGLGPLPADQRDRAAAVLAATRGLEQRVAVALDDISFQLAHTRRLVRPGGARPGPAYVDRLA